MADQGQETQNLAKAEVQKPTKRTKSSIPAKRIFTETATIFHDLYKLTLAFMVKEMSWNPAKFRDRHSIEHVHFFHTYDSSGKKQFYSTMVGGHFHEMEVVEQQDGPPLVKCKSGPLMWKTVYNIDRQRNEKKAVPVNDFDDHKHEIAYIQSNEVKFRKINEEAAKLIGKNAALTQKPKELEMK